MKNDMFADIAESYNVGSDRGLIKPSPSPISDLKINLSNNSENAFPIYKKPDTQEEMNELLENKIKEYKPFLEDFSKKLRLVGTRTELKEFRYCKDGCEEQNVTIPHYGGPIGDQRAVYATEFSLQNFDNKRVVLHFNGVDYIAQVFVNDTFVGSHEGFFSPFEFDITEFVHEGTNSLNITVLNKDKMLIEGEKIYAATGLGWDDPQTGWHHCPAGFGIYNSVYVDVRENAYITDLFPRVNDEASELWIDCMSTLSGRHDICFEISVYGQNFKHTEFEGLRVYPKTKIEVGLNDTFNESYLSANKTLGTMQLLKLVKGCNRFVIPVEIRNRRLWQTDSPYLYRVNVKMYVDEVLVSSSSKQFGIRTFKQDLNSSPKGKFYLNGREVRLFGANTMGFEQQDVFKGDTEQLIKDIMLAKVCNMNFWRITQRPVQEEVYDYCDRLGFMVQTDMPLFGGVNINQYCEVIRQSDEMERLVRSHPCCILDTYINEPFPNSDNKPNHWLNRRELINMFSAMDNVIHNLNPDRVIKQVDGDYDPPCESLPDNHCYSMWYNSHGIDMGKLYKGYWLDVKSGWHYGCGEFGIEALERKELMYKYYPEEWLKEPFDPSKIICCQTAFFHNFFYEKPKNIDEWIEYSQDYQAFAVKIMTSSFRRNVNMNTFALHLFIDAFPSGWMKAIVDCERSPKKAFFQYRDCLSPVFCSLRSDRFTFFEKETATIEAYLNNENCKDITDIKYMVEFDGKIIFSGKSKPLESISQGVICFKMPSVAERKKVKVYMAAFCNNEILHYACECYEVFPSKELNATHLTEYREFFDNIDEYINLIKQGKSVILNQIPVGEYNIDGKLIEVKKCGMGEYFFASRDTGHKCVQELLKNDISYLYDSKLDRITSVLHTTFQIKNGAVSPIISSYNKDKDGNWEQALACGEVKIGKGKLIINQLDISTKQENPCVVTLLNALNRYVSDDCTEN